MLSLSHVSVPRMISGLEELITPLSLPFCFWLFGSWHLVSFKFCFTLLASPSFCLLATGDDEAIGWPGLFGSAELWLSMSEVSLSASMLNWMLVFAWKDVNKLLENCCMPQVMQCHDTFQLPSASYIRGDISIQSAWYDSWQSSQATPCCFHVTERWHIWQGHFTLGPGFSSMSAEFVMSSRLRYSRHAVLLLDLWSGAHILAGEWALWEITWNT